MKVLLLQNLFYLPAHGGAAKANRVILKELARRGHSCHVVAPMSGRHGGHDVAGLLRSLAALGIVPDSAEGTATVFRDDGVTVHVVTDASDLVRYAIDVGTALRPDVTMVPSDDPGSLTLGAALTVTPHRTVYLAHTIQHFPFGPRAFHPSQSGERMVRRAAAVIAVSHTAADYLRRHAGVTSKVCHLPVYGDREHRRLGRADRGTVTMINACKVKGIDILLALADARADLEFLAVAGWGTDAADRAALAARANIRVSEPVDDIDEVFTGTRVVLMPSLLDETFGLTCVEAMLRGIPVLASEMPGLCEAKLGVPYTIPVRPIAGYRSADDSRLPAEPETPPQNAGPWLRALETVVDDPDHYREISRRSRGTASSFVASLSLDPLERILSAVADTDAPTDRDQSTALPPRRREALLAELRARRGGDAEFVD